jgi:hypothetical protein
VNHEQRSKADAGTSIGASARSGKAQAWQALRSQREKQRDGSVLSGRSRPNRIPNWTDSGGQATAGAITGEYCVNPLNLRRWCRNKADNDDWVEI